MDRVVKGSGSEGRGAGAGDESGPMGQNRDGSSTPVEVEPIASSVVKILKTWLLTAGALVALLAAIVTVTITIAKKADERDVSQQFRLVEETRLAAERASLSRDQTLREGFIRLEEVMKSIDSRLNRIERKLGVQD